MKTIGNNIKLIREIKNYSQEYMAEELNISQPTYSRMENGEAKIDADKIEEIADILGVSVDDIMQFHRKNFFKKKD